MEGLFFCVLLKIRHPHPQGALRETLGTEDTTMTNQQKNQIITLRLQGVGYVKIGQALGISNNTVRSFCRRNGLDGEAGKNTVRCQQCGKPIKVVPKRKPRKFCSDRCRTTWWNSRLDSVERKAIYHFTCAACGTEFMAYGNRHRKYCSHACYISDRFGKEGGFHE